MKKHIKFYLIFIASLAVLFIPIVVFAQSAKSNCVITKVGDTGDQKPNLPPECQTGGGGVPNADRAALLAKVKQYIDEGKLSFGASNDLEGLTNGTGQILRMDGTVVDVDTQVLRSYVYLVDQGFSFYVSCLVCSHNKYSSSGNVSRHWDGHASDIGTINGLDVINPAAKEVTIKFMQSLNTLADQGSDLTPDQVLCNGNGRVDPEVDGLSMNDGRLWPGFTLQYVNAGDHQDHVHVGY